MTEAQRRVAKQLLMPPGYYALAPLSQLRSVIALARRGLAEEDPRNPGYFRLTPAGRAALETDHG